MKTCCSSNTDKECDVNQMEKYLSYLDGLVKKGVKKVSKVSQCVHRVLLIKIV